MKLNRPILLTIALAILCAGLLRACDARATSWNVWIRVIAYDEKTKEVVVQPLVAPVVGSRIEEGITPPKGLLACVQKMENRKAVVKETEFVYPVIVFECQDGVRLSLTSIDFRQK